MDTEELKALLAEAVAPLNAEIAALKAGQAEIGNKIEAGKELHAKVAPFADKLRACADGMQAAGIGVHATRGHATVLRRMADGMEAEAMGGSMPHIFRDHDYNGGYMAGADRDEGKKDDKSADELTKLREQITGLEGKLAAARDDSKQPERKTLPPQITALLAKADITVPEGDNKLSVAKLDQVLASQNMPLPERMRLKTELRRANLLD